MNKKKLIMIVVLVAIIALAAFVNLRQRAVNNNAGTPVEFLENDFIKVTVYSDGRFSVLDKKANHEWTQQIPKKAAVLAIEKIEKESRNTVKIQTKSKPKAIIWLNIEDALPDIKLEIEPFDKDEKIQALLYPYPFVSSSEKSELVIPTKEGVLIPVAQSAAEKLVGLAQSWSWTMSWYGEVDESLKSGYITIADTPDDAVLAITNVEKNSRTLLAPAIAWVPTLGKFGYTRKTIYHFSSDGGYVSLAKYYRDYAIEKGYFKSLREKAAENPNVDKLIGGANARIMHITGISPETLLEVPKYVKKGSLAVNVFDAMGLMNKDGVPSDSKAKILLDPAEISKLEEKYPDFRKNFIFTLWTTHGGILVYKDSKKLVSVNEHPLNYQNPWVADNSILLVNQKGDYVSSDWISVYLLGKPAIFASTCPSGYLARLQDYINRVNKNYVYSFKDSIKIDLLGEPFAECWNEGNQSTRTQDKNYRIEELKYVKSGGYAVSAEAVGEWAVPYVDTSYNLLGITIGERDMAKYVYSLLGSKKAKVGAGYDEWFFNPYRRVPLQELVYHDAIISTFHDGDSNNFYYSSDGINPDPELQKKYWKLKDLYEILYGAAPNFHIVDDASFEEQKDRIKQTMDTVSEWHKKVGYDEMTGHEFLTPDRKIQKSTFSSGWSAIVNFNADKSYITSDGKTVEPMGYLILSNKQ